MEEKMVTGYDKEAEATGWHGPEVLFGMAYGNLTQHDLTRTPYPFGDTSMDAVVCAGVLNFFGDLGKVFREAGRILRLGGIFAFVVGDRSEQEDPAVTVGPEHTHADYSITMYRHSGRQVAAWAASSGLTPLHSLPFIVYMDREKAKELPARAYIMRKGDSPGSEGGA
jgi:predicted TPR repeat methyltransferase